MALLAFLLEAVLISSSGVLAPGPLSAVTVGKGSASPHAGALIAIGHGIVEFPLIVLVLFGFGRWLDQAAVRISIALLGGVLLVAMGIGMLRGLGHLTLSARHHDNSPLVAGVLLSIGNPYFLIWWATVGAALVLRAATFGVLGLATFAVAHWLCDFGWSYLLSALSFKGSRLFGRRLQTVLFAVSGVALLFFGGKFVFDAVKAILV